MLFCFQFVRPICVAWLVFLLVGVPLPVTHCHAFEMGPPQTGRVLQLHLCDCSHDRFQAKDDEDSNEDSDKSWHIHWVCFHFTDDPAGTLSSAHVDVIGNVSAVGVEQRVDVSRFRSLDKSLFVWLSHIDNAELGIRNLDTSYRSSSLARESKSRTDYCTNSSRLLL
jgi:hypothetical protein